MSNVRPAAKRFTFCVFCACLAFCPRANAQGNLITTYAGDGNGYSGDGGPATSARLTGPSGLAMDGSGNLYIADTGNNVIRKVSPAGIITTYAGNGNAGYSGDGGPATAASLNIDIDPVGVAVDASGNLYIADTLNNRVRMVSAATGIIATVAGNGFGAADGIGGFSGDGGPAIAAELFAPTGLAVDSSGNLLIADLGNMRVRKVAPNGTITTIAGSGCTLTESTPNCGGFSGDGGPATSATLNRPTALALDGSGNLYIADNENNRVRKVSPAGIITTFAGIGPVCQFSNLSCTGSFSGDGGPATSASLNDPQGLATDSAGNVYISDTNNLRVRKVSPAGIITTYAGSGQFDYNIFDSAGDGGPATSADINLPDGLATDAAGDLFIADNLRGRVREVLTAATPSAPAISGLSPNSVIAGEPAFTLTVNGSEFVSGSTVEWNGSAVATTYISASQLSASIPASLITAPSSVSITVLNPVVGASNTVTFTINPGPPPPPVTATPTFSIASGAYTSAQAVTISDATAGATIYYTTNGGTPTTASTVYVGAITVSCTETIEAIATASGYSTSAVAIATYTITTTTYLGSQASEWVWMSGSNADNQTGTYGALGTPSACNAPGGRRGAFSWTDSSGNLWLFGGDGTDISDPDGVLLSDLWMFNPSTEQWAWMEAGSYAGVYGTLGTPAAKNAPGARLSGVSWTDKSGNFWLFGGYGADSTGNQGTLKDLWEFNPSTGNWTWMSGSNTVGQPGVYGALGVPAAANVPGAREWATGWTDSAGNLWLWGGLSVGPTGTPGNLNDLWEFNPSTREWTWMSGGDATGQTAVYGTLGVPAAKNVPGQGWGASSWTDGSGNLWLYGGDAYGDLWEFSPSTGEWAWMGGSSPTVIQPATYGALGVLSAGNFPGYRIFAASWTDSSGNFWLFGGMGRDAAGNSGSLNDLWEFNPSIREWAWMGGSNKVGSACDQISGVTTCGQPGVYGSLGSAAAGNIPGARDFALGWGDSSGRLWLFGGQGFDSAGNLGWLNDLWEYQPSALTITPAATPTFSVVAGTYATAQTVTISDATAGATIYYTTNGTTPTTASSVYTAEITVGSTETVEAIATASGYSTSAVATATYTINLPPPPPVISGLSPSAVTAGGPAFTLTVNGSGFTGASFIAWNGTAVATSFVSANQVTASIPASLTASPGTVWIAIVQVEPLVPGGPYLPMSNAVIFAIGAAPGAQNGQLISHIADGGGWRSIILLANTDTVAAPYTVSFWNDAGSPYLPSLASGVPSGTIPLGGSTILETADAAAALSEGWAQVTSSQSVGGTAIFRYDTSGQEAAVPLLTTGGTKLEIPYQVGNGLSLGVALANTNASQTANITEVIRDQNGNQLSSRTLTLTPLNHTAFNPTFPSSATVGGVVEYDSNVNIFGLGIRSAAEGSGLAFTSLDAVLPATPSTKTISHIADGGGWRSTIILVNTDTVPAQYMVSFWTNNGSSYVPTLASGFPTGTIPVGGSTIIETADTASALSEGWAQVTSSQAVGGTAIFRYDPWGQEAAVPLLTNGGMTLEIPYQAGSGLSLGVALANPSSTQTANITEVIRDANGNQLSSRTLTLAPQSHTAFNPTFPATTTGGGVVEYDSNINIYGLGIRSAPEGTGLAFTSVRAVYK
jgi:hypothetical protein